MTKTIFKEESVRIAFEKHKPYLLDLETLVEKIGYGKLTCTLTVQDGNVTGLEVVGRQYIRYDKGESLTKAQ